MHLKFFSYLPSDNTLSYYCFKNKTLEYFPFSMIILLIIFVLDYNKIIIWKNMILIFAYIYDVRKNISFYADRFKKIA